MRIFTDEYGTVSIYVPSWHDLPKIAEDHRLFNEE